MLPTDSILPLKPYVFGGGTSGNLSWLLFSAEKLEKFVPLDVSFQPALAAGGLLHPVTCNTCVCLPSVNLHSVTPPDLGGFLHSHALVNVCLALTNECRGGHCVKYARAAANTGPRAPEYERYGGWFLPFFSLKECVATEPRV